MPSGTFWKRVSVILRTRRTCTIAFAAIAVATIQCYDATRGEMRLPEEISADILSAVSPLLASVEQADHALF